MLTMRLGALIGAVAVLLSTSACVSPRSISVSEASPIRATYEQGSAILKSQANNGVVLRVLTPSFSNETSELPAFFVAFTNGGSSEIDFSTANITAYSGGSPVKVYTYEALEKKIKREAALLAFALAMNGASQAMAASMPQTTNMYGSAQAYGSGGYARATFTGTATTYNPAAAAAARAQINANTMNQMAMIASARDIQVNSISSMLRRNTVIPGQIVGGVVKLHAPDIKRGRPLKIVILVEGESHEFIFEVA